MTHATCRISSKVKGVSNPAEQSQTLRRGLTLTSERDMCRRGGFLSIPNACITSLFFVVSA